MAISREMAGIVLTLAVLLAVTAAQSSQRLDFNQAALFTCGGSQRSGSTQALFPPSDTNIGRLGRPRYAARVQRRAVAAFCGNVQQYIACVQNRLRNPVALVDRLLRDYIDVENFDNAFELFCNNTALITGQFRCTRNAVLASSCQYGGTLGIIGLMGAALQRSMPQQHFCHLVTESIRCRVGCQLQTCDAQYAGVMEEFYYHLVGRYCPRPSSPITC